MQTQDMTGFSQEISLVLLRCRGANSHMAIRASELGIPAVIGAGQLNFQTWEKTSWLELDCANQLVKILK